MKAHIIAALERIAGDRLTPELREEIADEAVNIMETINKTAALAALETAKEKVLSLGAEPPKDPT